MKTVKDILKTKSSGSSILTIDPDKTVLNAIKVMAEKNVGALLVMENDKLVGIITERDYARKVILAGKSSNNTLVREIMDQNFLVIKPGTTIEECMALMVENFTRYLPVIDGNRVTGVISMGNVVNSIISEQNFVINDLQQYIMRG